MAMTDVEFQRLSNAVGTRWAKAIVTATEKADGELQGRGIRFKMPMEGMDEDMDDDEEDDDGKRAGKKPPKKGGGMGYDEDMDDDEEDDDEKSLSDADVVLFQGLKQLAGHTEASFKTLEKTRKQVKNYGNQIANLDDALKDVLDRQRRIESYLAQLAGRKPASKSRQTQYTGGDDILDDLIAKNHEGEQPVSVLNQMRKNAGVTIPTIPTKE